MSIGRALSALTLVIGAAGMVFAVPERARAATLGIGVVGVNVSEEAAEAFALSDASGFLVTGVLPDGPADQAGVVAGDLIVATQEGPVTNIDVLKRRLATWRAGERMQLVIWDGRQRDSVYVVPVELDQPTRERDPTGRYKIQFDEAKRAYEAKDYARAFTLFVPLARKGLYLGTAWLGRLYETGRGVRQNPGAAAYHYRIAAESGNGWSQEKLATLYRDGSGVSQDFARAYYWFERAAARGRERATEHRDALASKLTAAQLALARHWARPPAAAAPARPPRAAPSAARPATQPRISAEVREAQRLLAALGYDPGPADGISGKRTAQAVRDYQGANGLTTDGRVTAALLDALRAAAAPKPVPATSGSAPTTEKPSNDDLPELPALPQFD